MRPPMLLFATERYQELGEEIASAGDFDSGGIQRKIFPDGERYLLLARDVSKPGGAWGAPDRRYAIALGCEDPTAADALQPSWPLNT